MKFSHCLLSGFLLPLFDLARLIMEWWWWWWWWWWCSWSWSSLCPPVEH